MRDGVPVWIGAVGFGLAAQLDGLVLQGMLGWHHLLSDARPGASEAAHRLSDAAFDAVMAAVLLAGLLGLLAQRRALPALRPSVALAAGLAGFGLWHVTDAVVVHWLLRLHRVNPRSAHPLVWDILWPAVLGVAPLALAAALLRPPQRVPGLDGPPTTTATGPVPAPTITPAGTPPVTRRSPGTRRQRKGPPP